MHPKSSVKNLFIDKNAFQWDAYRPLQWPSRGVYNFPPPCGQTDACENIIFPQLLLQTVKINYTFEWKHIKKKENTPSAENLSVASASVRKFPVDLDI